MTATHPQRRTSLRADGTPAQRPAQRRPRRKLRVLAVVDGTERTNRVTNYIIMACDPRITDVIVLNVQEKREDAKLRGYQSFKETEINERLIDEIGTPIVSSVRVMLERSGVNAVGRVTIGERVQTILQCAAEERCDIIVIAGDASGGLGQRIFDLIGIPYFQSQAARVSARAPVPVVVVK